MKANKLKIYRIAAMGIFSALSIILVYFIHVPIFPVVSFLEYDPADIPIIICGYLFGPLYGLIMTVVVSVVQGLTVSMQSGWIGIVMHILATGSLVLANSGLRRILRSRSHTLDGALSPQRSGFIDVISAFAGIIAMTLTMTLWNLLFTPAFMGVTLDDVLPLIPFIVLFNVIKAILNSIAALIVYRLIPRKLTEAFMF